MVLGKDPDNYNSYTVMYRVGQTVKGEDNTYYVAILDNGLSDPEQDQNPLTDSGFWRVTDYLDTVSYVTGSKAVFNKKIYSCVKKNGPNSQGKGDVASSNDVLYWTLEKDR